MSDEPKTVSAAMMMLDMEGQRLEARDRRLAMSIGAAMLERFFDPARIEDMRDVREQIVRAAEHAAYEAIQKEREFHAGDMKSLRVWADARWVEEMLKPPKAAVIPNGDTAL